MYTYVLYYNIEKSGFNAVSASLIIQYYMNCMWGMDAMLLFVRMRETRAINCCEFSIVGDLCVDVFCDKVLE